MVSLLQHIEDGPQDSDGGQSAEDGTVLNKLYYLIQRKATKFLSVGCPVAVYAYSGTKVIYPAV